MCVQTGLINNSHYHYYSEVHFDHGLDYFLEYTRHKKCWKEEFCDSGDRTNSTVTQSRASSAVAFGIIIKI